MFCKQIEIDVEKQGESVLSTLASYLGDTNAIWQVADARVIAGCYCGCPSLKLRSEAPPLNKLPSSRVRQLQRDDHVGVSAHGVNARGDDVSVTAHFLNGRLVELEVYAGDGGDVRLD